MNKQTSTINSKRRKVMPVVAVIFNDEGKILLSQRHAPTHPHSHEKWQFPGGGLEFGEHPKETALREVKEEINLEIELVTDHPLVHSQVYATVPVQAIVLAYPARYKSGIINTSRDRQTKDAKWFNYNDIPWENTLPRTKEIIDEAREIVEKNF